MTRLKRWLRHWKSPKRLTDSSMAARLSVLSLLRLLMSLVVTAFMRLRTRTPDESGHYKRRSTIHEKSPSPGSTFSEFATISPAGGELQRVAAAF